MSAPRGGPGQQGVTQRSSSAPRTRPARNKRGIGQRREGRIESSASSENEASAQVGPWAASYDEIANLDAGIVGAASPDRWDDSMGASLENGMAHGPVPLLRQGRSLHRKISDSAHRLAEGLGQGWCRGFDEVIAARNSTHGMPEDRGPIARARATQGRGEDTEERHWFASPASRNHDELDAEKGFDPIPTSTLVQSSTAPKVIRYYPLAP